MTCRTGGARGPRALPVCLLPLLPSFSPCFLPSPLAGGGGAHAPRRRVGAEGARMRVRGCGRDAPGNPQLSKPGFTPHPSRSASHLLPQGEKEEGKGISSCGPDPAGSGNPPRFSQLDQCPSRFPPRSARPGPSRPHTPPVPSPGGLVRPATLASGGSGWSGAGGASRPAEGDHHEMVPGMGRGGYSDRSRTACRGSLPAGGDCGKARQRPPGAGLPNNQPRGASREAETVYSSCPGFAPGAPPALRSPPHACDGAHAQFSLPPRGRASAEPPGGSGKARRPRFQIPPEPLPAVFPLTPICPTPSPCVPSPTCA